MSKFVGIAYWRGAQLPVGWTDQAAEVLQPVTALGWRVERLDGDPSRPIVVSKPDGEHGDPVRVWEIRVMAGSTQGMVQDGPDAGVILLMLMALRRKPGGIELVDHDQNPIPPRVIESYPPFAGDIDNVRAVAEALGLMPSAAVKQKLSAMLARVI